MDLLCLAQQTYTLVKLQVNMLSHTVTQVNTHNYVTATNANSNTMISFLLSMAGLLNLLFYVFAIGCAISFILEQWLKNRPLSVDSTINERNNYIVQTNRRYCWRQAWMVNIYWFLCNIGLYFISRSMATPTDTFWNGI